MNPSGWRLRWAESTCATAPAIATPVASSTLSDIRYTARNTMVEKKSLASLANTFFIIVSLNGWPGIQKVGVQKPGFQDAETTAGSACLAAIARRCFGYHLVKSAALLRAASAIAIPAQNGRPGR